MIVHETGMNMRSIGLFNKKVWCLSVRGLFIIESIFGVYLGGWEDVLLPWYESLTKLLELLRIQLTDDKEWL